MHQEVGRIRSKLVTNPWPKYLSSVKIEGLRGWSGQEVRFQFPVTVICGENGSGKSTVLKAIAAAYRIPGEIARSYYASTFFPDTPWEEVSDVTLTYLLKEGPNSREYKVRKPSERWRYQRNRPERYVILQDVSRTLPLDATIGYGYIAKRTAVEVSAESLTPEITRYFASIMGRQYSDARFALSNVDNQRSVGVVQSGDTVFSQFHQGAGEDATLDLMALLQNIPATALFILDEAEASLHPRAQRRLVHFLLWLARTKHLQIVLSTHSPYILEELPLEARVFLARNPTGIDIMYGVTPNFALNRMDDIDRPELYIFTEDNEASVVSAAILRSSGTDLTRFKFVEVGPGNVVNSIGIASRAPSFPVPSIGVIDADAIPGVGSLKLPRTLAPERQVFGDVSAGAVPQSALCFGVSEDSMRSSIDSAMSVVDHHAWPSHLARLTGHTVSFTWETLSKVWVANCLSTDEISEFCDGVMNALPDA